MSIQFKKGVLELCVLSLLAKNDYYGYELVKKISNTIAISEGDIYPLLRSFTKEGYIEAYFNNADKDTKRKYYKITSTGFDLKIILQDEWDDLISRINIIIKEVN